MSLAAESIAPSEPTPLRSCAASASSPSRSQQRARLEALIRTHQPGLRAYALRLCRRRADADDLVQDALERALKSQDDFESQANLRNWLVAIMRNLFFDQCRRRARWRSDGDQLLSNLPAPLPEAPEFWREVEPEQLEGALARIDDGLRQTFALRWRENRSYRDIAEQLDIPLNTVGTRLWRVRQAIREQLGEGGTRTGVPLR